MKKKTTTQITTKPKMGRPSSYKPEYCEALLKHMAEGYSIEAFAGSIRVSRETIYAWCDQHPDFADTKRIGFALCQLWWETRGKIGLIDKSFNSAIWIFNMKNRFSWRDRHDVSIDATITAKDQKHIDELKALIKAEIDEQRNSATAKG